jgi:hypothetical protein
MLVAPFEVHVGRASEVRSAFENGGMADTRIKPDIEDIHFLLETTGPAMGAERPHGDEIRGLALEPDIGAELADELDDMIQDLLVGDDLAALSAIKNG